jgi:hypothetical protein
LSHETKYCQVVILRFWTPLSMISAPAAVACARAEPVTAAKAGQLVSRSFRALPLARSEAM